MVRDNLARILKDKRHFEKKSQAEIARRAGLAPSSITDWLKGRSSPTWENMIKLSESLEVTLGDLIGDIPNAGDTFYIPILGTVPAGNPIEAVEYHEGSLPLPKALVKRVDFGLKVKGSSMIGASILDGDIVLVKQTFEILNKQIVVATIDGEATVKRFYKNGDSIILKPENNDFEPILVNPLSDFRLVRLVTGLWRQEIR